MKTREAPSCTVTLLRPPGTSVKDHFERVQKSADAKITSSDVLRDHIDGRIEDVREGFERHADQLGMHVSVYEHQLHADVPVPGRKASRDMVSSEIVAAIDPSTRLLAWICACIRKNPVVRSFIAFTDAEEHEQLYRFLASQTCQVLCPDEEGGGWDTIPRIFSPLLRREEEVQNAIQQVLTFPRCATLFRVPSYRIQMIRRTHVEGTYRFERDHLRDTVTPSVPPT